MHDRPVVGRASHRGENPGSGGSRGAAGGVAKRLAPRHYEDAHQAALFDWAAFSAALHPELAGLAHVPNGGRRGKLEASRLKRQGVRAGYPDILLDVARGPHHGLRIELKATKRELGRNPEVSKEQRVWLARLNANGFRAVVCEGWEAARDEIVSYLALPVPARCGMQHPEAS